MRIRLPHKWDAAFLSNLAWVVVRSIGFTLRMRVLNSEKVDDRLAHREGQLLVTWHGRTLVPLLYFRRKRVVSMVSPSRDGEIQYRLHRRFGWDAVRGSTGRDATRAVLNAVRRLRAGDTLAVAPDGPKGPAGVAQPGVLYLALKSGCPIVPAGVSASSAWFVNSWDRFLVPKPGARVAMIFGEPIYPPKEGGEAWIRDTARYLEEVINSLQDEANTLTGFVESAAAVRAS